MIRWGVSDQTPQAPMRIIGTTVKELKVGTMITTIKKVNMFEMETTIATTTSTVLTMVIGMIGVGP